MKKITNLCKLLILFGITFTYAQTARVQVIHNSPDLAAQEVDVYINGTIALDNFAFRTATPFIDLPAHAPITIDVAPASSTSVLETLSTTTTTLTAGETYIIVANGIVSPSGYSVAPNFALSVYSSGREGTSVLTETDVLVAHGSPDAPTVDVVETGVGAGTIVNNLSYGSFSNYLELTTANYVLDVRDETGTVSVARYSAPLSDLFLQSDAITVVASGFLNPANNSNGPAFGLWVAKATGGALIPLPLYNPTAKVQVIHNSPDAIAAEVDVYINGDLALDNFAFRTATPFIELPAETSISIDIAPSTSSSSSESIYNLTTSLAADETYIIVANGIVSPTGYSVAPNFALNVFSQGREFADDSNLVDVLVNHGSPDAPTVDVVETAVPAGTVVDNISYPQFAGYLSLPEADFVLDVRDETGATTVASYQAPFNTFNYAGSAITVLASGFLNPAVNSDGPAFGLWVAFSNGGPLFELPLVEVPQTARLQVIHNSPDAIAAEVDVYVNGTLTLDNFAFRTATPFIDVPAGVALSIDVAPGNSTSATESVYNLTTTLADGETYIAIANGIVSPTGYSVAPNFALSVFAQGREVASDPAETDVLVNHGSPDAPTVDVVETGVGAGTIVNDISYPQFAGYLELPNLDFVLDVRDATGTTTVASYLAPLQTLNLDGAALTVVASGFLNPAANSNGPAFGLWVATAAGGNLIQLPPFVEPTARLQVIHNSPDAIAAEVDVYVNGTLTLDNFAFRTATPFIDVPAGVALSIDVAPGNSTSATESVYNLTTTLADGETYIAIANGIVSPTGYSVAPNFALSVFAQGREVASDPAETDVLVNHGSPDAPTVDVVETGVGAGTIVNDISYPQFAGYLELPNLDFVLDVRDATGTTTVASYLAPLQTLNLDGAAITVIASGFLNPAVNSDGPAFGLWVATAAGGNLIPLSTAPLSVNENDLESIRIYPNPANSIINIDIPFSYDNSKARLYDVNGRSIKEVSSVNSIDVTGLESGIYMLSLEIDNTVINKKIVITN
ncbi:MAG: hypothetical protein DCF13_00740 [Flavobacteriaceae bacterium]|nr:MAG: hypothetical protein DCF13_00740 [Flavobacteriaceae bacterium]